MSLVQTFIISSVIRPKLQTQSDVCHGIENLTSTEKGNTDIMSSSCGTHIDDAHSIV